MPASIQPAGVCPKCGANSVVCRFNYFDRGDLQVHSWEHKCANCGWRETAAYRSDTPATGGVDPSMCPWCRRKSAT